MDFTNITTPGASASVLELLCGSSPHSWQNKRTGVFFGQGFWGRMHSVVLRPQLLQHLCSEPAPTFG